jgi:biopolymer transport protein ExbB/TolQ
VGLLAAIPATIAYNAFGGRIDALVGMLDRFSGQFEQDLARLVQGPSMHSVSDSDVSSAAGAEPR